MAILKNLEATELLVMLDRKRHLKLAAAGDPGDEKEVDDYFVTRTAYAYPLFEIDSMDWAQTIVDHFTSVHPNVHFTGRQARFSYINIDHCMHFAGELVKKIAGTAAD